MHPLPVACLAFTATDDIAGNVERIRDGLQAAHAAGARVLLTPECSLCGYPGSARSDFAGCDWALLAAAESQLSGIARELGLLLVLGTASTTDGAIGNDALACGVVPSMRYRKQCLTPTDHGVFTAGSTSTLVDLLGWRLGIGICFDLRFPDVWMDLAQRGADAYLVIAHMAGADPDPGTKQRLIPALCAVRAAETATPLAFANTAAPDRYLDSGCWDARGACLTSRGEGLIRQDLIHRSRLDPWYGALRTTALDRWRGRRP